MRVAIDVQNLLRPMTGVGYYVSHLVRALSRLELDGAIEAFYFSRRTNRIGFAGGPVVETPVRFPPGRILQFLWKRCSRPRVDRFIQGVDVFHFPNFVARPVKRGTVVLTIPDLSFLRFPQFAERKNLSFLTRHVPRSIERADRIIAISEFTRREIAEFFPSAREKLDVTPLGVSEAFAPKSDEKDLSRIKKTYNLPGEYILFVGTLEPRKNLKTLLKAYRIFSEKSEAHARIALVVAGMRGWRYEETLKSLRGMPPGMTPILTGYVEENDMPGLYSAARMAVVPSVYEGFGLPCLETMACGTPLVCSNTSSLPEVVGDAAIQVPPDDPEEMAKAMGEIVANSELASQLVRKGLERAKMFTWRRCAEATYCVYENAVSG